MTILRSSVATPIADVLAKPRAAGFADESLIADPRGSVRPAQVVEQKLISLLKTNAVPVSFTLQRNGVSGRSR